MTMMEKWRKYVGEDGIGYCLKDAEPPRPTMEEAKYCRKLCKENVCGFYGVTWGCPPGTGSVGQCLSLLKRFPKAVIAYCRFRIDLSERETIERLASQTQSYIRRFSNGLREEGYRTLPLASGGCNYCDRCAYPDECRCPDQKVASISSYGIGMMRFLEDNGLDFRFEDGYVTLYGMVLYIEPRD